MSEQVRIKLTSWIKELHNYRHYILISIIHQIFPKYLDSDSAVKIKNTEYKTAFNYMAILFYHVWPYIVQFALKLEQIVVSQLDMVYILISGPLTVPPG